MGIVLIGVAVASLLVRGNVRAVTLVLLTILGILCLNPRRGIYVLLVFLPFMYFLRRQVLHFQEFAQRDPILLFPPLVTIAIFLGLVVFYNKRLYGYFRRSVLLKAVLGLLVLFTLQVFNPLQGSILVGAAGAIYFIIPMLWIFMGLLLDETDIRRILALLMIIGTVTALYGIYQNVFGFSDVERYELESKGFYKLLGTKARAVSTFAGLGDFSVYLSIAGFLAFAHYWRNKVNVLYLGILGIIALAMLAVANRTSMLVLLFAILTFLTLYARRLGQILLRGLALVVIVGSLYGYLYTFTPGEIFQRHRSSNPFVVHTVAGITQPTQESTFKKRVWTWAYVVGPGLLQQPFGRGLGSTTTAAAKFTGGDRFEVDSYFFEIIYGSGPLAAVLFAAVVCCFFRDALRLTLRDPTNFSYKVVIGMVAAYVLGSVFGVDVRDSVNGPVAWLVIGWVVKEAVDRSEELARPAERVAD
jgi:hypothetical protein